MSTDLQLSLDNLTQWAGHLQMRVEALETKVYGSPTTDQPKKAVTPRETKLKPDCPGYAECKEMLTQLSMRDKTKSIEIRILKIVRKESASVSKVVDELRRGMPEVTESQGRQIVWQLIDRGKLRLTEDRVLAARQ